MPVKLINALREMLDGWQHDLPEQWRAILGKVELGFDQCNGDLELEFWEPIYPARHHSQFPGAPKSAHIFHAFDNLDPANIRCVLLGQDPYPSPEFATGRAFEAGNVADWRELNKMFSKSVRVFLQQIYAERSGDHSYASSFNDWHRMLSELESEAIEFEQPEQLADRWVDQGVLLLNSSLTISRFRPNIDIHQSQGHLPVWEPLIQAVLGHCSKASHPIAFIAFGDVAIEQFRKAGIEGDGVIKRSHPANAQAVLQRENPFTICNRFLQSRNAEPIAW